MKTQTILLFGKTIIKIHIEPQIIGLIQTK